MNLIFKKIVSLYVGLHLCIGSVSPYINMMDLNAAEDVVSQTCVNKGTSEFLPITDERNTSVLIKKEFNRDCVLTKNVQGACKVWETTNEDFAVDGESYDAYRSENHSGSVGELLGMISAYDQLEHLWSGWKGYCEVGTKTDFDWASDPAFWAGLIASTIMDGSQEGQFLGDTGFGEGIRGMQDGMTSALGNWAGKAGGKCLMAAGFDMGKSLLSYAVSGKSDDKCDPVDEFCGDELTQTEESDIMTIDKQQYEDMIIKNPEYADYIIVLDDGQETGVMSIRYKKVNEIEDITQADLSKLSEIQEKLKTMTLVISMAMTAGKMAACMATDGSIGDSASGNYMDNNSPMFSVKNGLSMAISMIPAQYLGPYGALIKAALQIIVNFLFSFKDIDSCKNQDDADEQGSRHSKTCTALKHNLCHFVYSKCVENCGGAFMGMAKELVGYNYCCYDQLLTKTLVVQLKAQLGRDWSHCTGISLRDMNFVSFRQCTNSEKQNGTDGGKENLGLTYDPMTSFQYKNKCIDLTEFKEYLKAQIGDDIDLTDFDSIFSDIKNK